MTKYGSPIEEMFAAALEPLVAQEYDAGRDISVQPQAHIGPFRVDFLLAETVGRGFAGFERDVTVRLVVECDGHDFHERTKEQAARDRERDRMLLAAGHPVIRFTGSQIHADTAMCAEDALNIMVSLSRLQAWGEV